MFRQLTNRVVLITGASSGIGESCARLFHQQGNHVILLGRRIERLNEIKSQMEKTESKSQVVTIECDVSCQESVNKMVESIPTNLKDIDILINNAGLALGVDPVSQVSMDDVDKMFDTNVKGVFKITRALLNGMIQRNRGHIFNVSSIAGHQWYVNGSIYCATKAAVNAFSDVLRKEVVATKIRVTNVCPGLVETEFSLVRFAGDQEKAKKPYIGIEPLVPDDIADNIFYCASRPEHVQITTIETMANNQAATTVIHRT
ncbi:hypothetical protein SAMD00019534_106360 [Acytostelium subglobosum LB1]|uniref:hypothetical protein n=1 Tax=Acytostelium subglobosum LB1 TaxID=1410327 RepID=UPI000644B8B5|nr:hypothetical protein SAMD00019534_106360 [Acytostelium subglobosum LB1]GAM27460.1 hypothetical protein SAMD00019534_106360 [Acytostelium subglobosum LB1]|eukprot:XP_012749525.1 hypothetical protein SAMD00019534_106360 [Acytostelium subglobosum LB1]